MLCLGMGMMMNFFIGMGMGIAKCPHPVPLSSLKKTKQIAVQENISLRTNFSEQNLSVTIVIN